MSIVTVLYFDLVDGSENDGNDDTDNDDSDDNKCNYNGNNNYDNNLHDNGDDQTSNVQITLHVYMDGF